MNDIRLYLLTQKGKLAARNGLVLLLILGLLYMVGQAPAAKALLGGGRGGGGGLSSNSGHTSRQPASINNGLVAYYPMDGDANDKVQTATNNLTANGAVSMTTGKQGNALVNAAGTYLSLTDNASVSMNGTNFTIAGWFYPTTVPGAGGYVGLVTKWSGTASAAEYALYLKGGTGTPKFMFVVGNGTTTSTELTADTFGAVSINNWYFVVAQYDSVNNQIKISVNNGAFDTATFAGGIKDGTNELRIGRDQASSYLAGRADSVGLWKRNLSAADMTDLYNSGNGRAYSTLSAALHANLISFWDLDEASTATRADANRRGTNDGTVSGATLTTGKFNQGYSFASSSQQSISIPTSSATTLSSAGTISAWVNYTTVITASRIVTHGQVNAFHIGIDDVGSGKFKALVYDGANKSVLSNAVVNTGQWYHVVATFDGANISLYVNGELQNTAAAGNINYNGQDARTIIGAWGGLNGGWMNGTVDDVRIYNVALSASDVSKLYGGSSPVKCDQSCVGYWPLDETSGTTAADVTHTNANNLTPVNTPTQLSGQVGNSAHFTAASSQSLTGPSGSQLSPNAGSFTFATWAYLDSKSSFQIFGGKWDNGPNREYYLAYNNSADRFQVAVSSTGSDGTGFNADNFGSPSLSTWYYIVGWYDSVGQTMNIQVNNGTANTTSYLAGLTTPKSLAFQIGNSGNSLKTDGRLDEMGYWNRTLTAAERTALYNSGSGVASGALTAGLKNGLVSYWDFEEASGTRYDSYGGTGLTVASPTQNSEGIFNGSYKFNGTSQYIYNGNYNPFGTTNTISVEAWIKTSASIPEYTGIVIRNYNNIDWALQGDTSGNKVRFIVNGYSNKAVSNAALNDGLWHHLVGTYDGTLGSANIKLYVDGVLQTTTANLSANVATASDGVTIGADANGANSASGFYFNGNIDDVRLYSRALPQYEVNEHYLAGRN